MSKGILIVKIFQNLFLKKVFVLSFLLCSVHVANAQDLQTLIAKALANNPKIQKFELQYRRVSEKINEVSAIPNTEFGVGYFVSEPETRTGAQRFNISAKQMLPWFGTIASREKYVNSLAIAKYEDIVIAKRKLILSVSQVYYNLYSNKATQNLYIKNLKLLETYKTILLNAVEVGKASTVDVLRLQMRKNELQQVKDVLQQQYLAEQTSLNNLLNRENDIPVKVLDYLTMPSEKIDITSKNLDVHPEILKYDKLYQSIEQSELLNQKESRPMIGFGVNYMNVTERPNMNFSDNGKDIIMPMLAVSIPIFNKKNKSISKQNELQQQEITAQKKERLNTLKTLLDKAIYERISSKISYKSATKNLQQAKMALQILLKKYETSTLNFNDVLDLQELQLKFQISQITSVKNYYIQSSIVNYLIQ